MNTKQCTKCGETKELESFYAVGRGKQGRTSQCKDCVRDYQRKWRQENPEYGRKWRDENRERYREHQRKSTRKRYQENRNKELERFRQWRQDNAEHVQRYYRDNVEEYLTREAKRRIRKFGLADVNTPEERDKVIRWRKMMRAADLPCVYCRGPIDWESGWFSDHWLPISKGGRDVRTNVVPCCRSCNEAKHARYSGEEMQMRMQGEIVTPFIGV